VARPGQVECQFCSCGVGAALAKSNALEHALEHRKELLVGHTLAAGPGQERGITDIDGGQPPETTRLEPEAAISVLVGTRSKQPSKPERKPSGAVPVVSISVAGCPSTVILVTLEKTAPSLAWAMRYLRYSLGGAWGVSLPARNTTTGTRNRTLFSCDAPASHVRKWEESRMGGDLSAASTVTVNGTTKALLE
jgi:hypothetical protein